MIVLKRNLLFAFLLIISMTLSGQDFAGGNGSEELPYLITNREQFNNLRYYIGSEHKGKHFKVMNDIDFSDEEWAPIGNNESNAFQGYLHGNNKELRNIRIVENAAEYEYTGLFGAISTGAVIDSLHLVSTYIQGRANGNSCTGGIAGVAYSYTPAALGKTIRNEVKIIACSHSGTIIGGGSTGSNTGGLLGQAAASGYGRGSGRGEAAIIITACRNYADVTSGGAEFAYAGGLIGNASALGNATGAGTGLGSIELLYSYNRGNINVLKGSAGGLIGYLNINQVPNAIGEIKVTNCYATGKITGMALYAGGLGGQVRQQGSSVVLKNNVAVLDNIESIDDEYAHRLIGLNKNVTFVNNFALESMMVNGMPVDSDDGQQGIGKSFKELFTQATYTDTLVFLWHFDSICTIRADNVNLPYLACQSAPVIVNNFTPQGITVNVYNDLEKLQIYNNRTGELLTTVYNVKAGYANYSIKIDGELLPNDPIAVYSYEPDKQASYPIVLTRY